jgi:outer membrane protein assembly factor BamC
MKTKIITLLISAAALSALSACSYVKSLFPDKEKDYQYTTEIPPLIMPDDLKKG